MTPNTPSALPLESVGPFAGLCLVERRHGAYPVFFGSSKTQGGVVVKLRLASFWHALLRRVAFKENGSVTFSRGSESWLAALTVGLLEYAERKKPRRAEQNSSCSVNIYCILLGQEVRLVILQVSQAYPFGGLGVGFSFR